MTIILVDAATDSLTISWPAVEKATKYILEYKKEGDENFQQLSDSIASPAGVRKRNLEANTSYYFRAKKDGDDWITHESPFQTSSDSTRMDAPSVVISGNLAGLVSWKESGGEGYELQMREYKGGAEWQTIAPQLSGTNVRKKNLTHTDGYQFRVRPVGATSFSEPSTVFVPLGLSAGLKSLFNTLDGGTLLRTPDEKVPLEEALGGKEFVLLYASAHWCGPCRSFTPMLTKWYNSLGPSRNIEIIFLSSDHDENSFKNYFGSMPWLAIDYDDEYNRDQLMGWLRVTGIPRLAVLDGRTGRIIEDNAVNQSLDINRWRALANKK